MHQQVAQHFEHVNAVDPSHKEAHVIIRAIEIVVEQHCVLDGEGNILDSAQVGVVELLVEDLERDVVGDEQDSRNHTAQCEPTVHSKGGCIVAGKACDKCNTKAPEQRHHRIVILVAVGIQMLLVTHSSKVWFKVFIFLFLKNEITQWAVGTMLCKANSKTSSKYFYIDNNVTHT